jgi:dihydroneopterin aldolase/2-amino-4-hydroxy-6-hydroxymethyldihydropteridine diphosphokinase
MSGDRISLRGVRAMGHHGVFDHEKRDGQEFVVDVDLTLDLSRACASDDLADTYDYGALAGAVVARIEGEPYDLVERLAGVVAEDVLGDLRVEEVRVTVHKPQAPVSVVVDDIAVTVSRTRGPVPVVVAVGANLPYLGVPPSRVVVEAAESLGQTGTLDDARVSALFETDPVGGPEDQPAYVNAVVVGTTTLSPQELLDTLHLVERAYDRTREERWGARTLDLDLVQYGDPSDGTDVRSEDPELTLPHPRAHERAFVLVPWLDADPAARLRVGDRAVPVGDLLDAVGHEGVRPLGRTPGRAPGDA